MVFFFFFSSRRRHTRCLSDWSSDVCSSDLVVLVVATFELADGTRYPGFFRAVHEDWDVPLPPRKMRDGTRSEERRVGKECRSRWWPYDEKKKRKKKRRARSITRRA